MLLGKALPVVLPFLATVSLGLSVQTSKGTYAPNPPVVEYGTYSSELQLCFEKLTLDGAASPATFTHITPTCVEYVHVETLNPEKSGGATADIVAGGITKGLLSLQVEDAAKKSSFKSNVRVRMYCAS